MRNFYEDKEDGGWCSHIERALSEESIRRKPRMVPALVYTAYRLANPVILPYQVRYAATYLCHSGVESLSAGHFAFSRNDV
jgi:hypothetical protein